jgi:ATP-dependent RNA helicase DDX18/HAS1
LKTLCIDEADRILEIGFEDEMRQIIKLLPGACRHHAASAHRSPLRS